MDYVYWFRRDVWLTVLGFVLVATGLAAAPWPAMIVGALGGALLLLGAFAAGWRQRAVTAGLPRREW